VTAPAPTEHLIDPDPVRRGHELRKLLVSLVIAGVASIAADIERSFADADDKPDLPPREQPVAESYALPITPPLHQGDTVPDVRYAQHAGNELPLPPSRVTGLAVAGREFDLSPDGSEASGPSHDPDARPETRVKFVKLEVLIDLIHRSLARGQAVVWGSPDRALLIYGGDYDRDGKPLSYLIKDSFEPFTYRESADEIHKILHDVTVAR
jgi:hypothetical protein